MKKRLYMMLWAASLTGISGMAAAQINGMPLMACNNALPQPYTTTTAGSTAIVEITIEYYGSINCGALSRGTVTYGGMVGLNPSNAFNYCSGAGDNPATRSCLQNAQSFRIVNLIADGTGSVNQNGSCIRVNCSGGNFNSWSVQSEATLDLQGVMMNQKTHQKHATCVVDDEKHAKKPYEPPCLIKLIEQPQSGNAPNLNENTNGFIES